MTHEMYNIIIRLALDCLLEKSDGELRDICLDRMDAGDDEWITRENIQWCLNNTPYPDDDLDKRIDAFLGSNLPSVV